MDRETRFREPRVVRRQQRGVGKANRSRECAPGDKLRVPTPCVIILTGWARRTLRIPSLAA